MSNGAGALTFFLLMQLVLWVLLLCGGIYLLYALGRAAAGIDRVADALETLVAQREIFSENAASPENANVPINSARTFVPSNVTAAPPTENRSEL